VKEFLVNISEECDNSLSQEYQKVYVRGECVHFSPNIINKFLGINEPCATEPKVTENQICKEITANHVNVWPKKGKISSRKLAVKYVILNQIAAINWVPITDSSDVATGLRKFIYLVGVKTKVMRKKLMLLMRTKRMEMKRVLKILIAVLMLLNDFPIFRILCVGYALNFFTPKCVLYNFVHLVCLSLDLYYLSTQHFIHFG